MVLHQREPFEILDLLWRVVDIVMAGALELPKHPCFASSAAELVVVEFELFRVTLEASAQAPNRKRIDL